MEEEMINKIKERANGYASSAFPYEDQSTEREIVVTSCMKVIEEFQNDLIKHNNENEQTGDDRIIAQITWTVADIKKQLKDELKREPTEEEVEDCLEFFEDETCEDQSTSYGWEFILSAVANYIESLEDEEE